MPTAKESMHFTCFTEKQYDEDGRWAYIGLSA